MKPSTSSSLFLILIGLSSSYMTIYCDATTTEEPGVKNTTRQNRDLHVTSFSIAPNDPFQFPSSHDSMTESHKEIFAVPFNNPQFDLNYLNPTVSSKSKSAEDGQSSKQEEEDNDSNSSNLSSDTPSDSAPLKVASREDEDVSEGRDSKGGKDEKSIYYYYYPQTMQDGNVRSQGQESDSGVEEDSPVPSYSVPTEPDTSYGYPSPMPAPAPSPQYGYPSPPSSGYFAPQPSPSPQYGYPTAAPPPPPPPPSPQYGYPTAAPPPPPPPPAPQYGYPAPMQGYGYGQGSGNLPALTTGGGFGGGGNGGGGGDPGITGTSGIGGTGPPNGPPIKGAIDYVLIPLILIGIAAPIFVVVYVVLGSFEAKLAPVVMRRSLSWMNSSLESIKPTTDALVSSVTRALNTHECWERMACQVGSYCHRHGISDAGMDKTIETFVPKTYQRSYRAFMDSMKNSDRDCSAYKCLS